MESRSMNRQHPVLRDMVTSGCKSQLKVAVAFQIYLDLCEVQAMADVQHCYNAELDLLYLTGKQPHSAMDEVFVPLSSTSDLTLNWIEDVQNKLCEGRNEKGITLVLKEQDSLCVYYRLTPDLVAPDSPETTKNKKMKKEARYCIETELRRNSQSIFQQAIRNTQDSFAGIKQIANIDKTADYSSNEKDTQGRNDNATGSATENTSVGVPEKSAVDETFLNVTSTTSSTEVMPNTIEKLDTKSNDDDWGEVADENAWEDVTSTNTDPVTIKDDNLKTKECKASNMEL